MNNYVKVVNEDNRIEDTFFFDDTSEVSIRQALTKAGLAVTNVSRKTRLAMWRMPVDVFPADLLGEMSYSTPCLKGRHRMVTITSESGRETTLCEACGRSYIRGEEA